MNPSFRHWVPQNWVEVQSCAKGQYEIMPFTTSLFAQVAGKEIHKPVLMRVEVPYRPERLWIFICGKVPGATAQGAPSAARVAETEVVGLATTVKREVLFSACKARRTSKAKCTWTSLPEKK